MRLRNFLSSFVLLSTLASCSSGGDGDDGARTVLALVNAFPLLQFNHPVDIHHPGDGTNRLFVVEQEGVVRVFENDVGTKDAGVFLDISDKVVVDGNELGAHAMAFHPDFAANGHFFMSYTAANPLRSIISRFNVGGEDPDTADPGSELIILEILQPQAFHNVGRVSFGPDGFLYIGVGDGGFPGGVTGTGQDLTTILGSILRIDVDNPEGDMDYGIPPDNPFAGNMVGLREEIYAYGFRNPWRFTWDTVTGVMWAGDVGQNRLEEIDIVEKGANYGWSIMEGTLCFDPSEACDETGLTLPIFEYDHTIGIAIIGGFVYRGSMLPELAGMYIYADLAGKVWALGFDGVEVLSNTLLFSFEGIRISSFGVDQNQELFVCVFEPGTILKFVSMEAQN
ncbi:MAG: PQQ-dependent sugar dehydrogenase [Thermodesulfobacteriota bacterium]